MKLIFCTEINIKVSEKLISSLGYLSFLQGDSIILFMVIIKDSQSTKSSKFAISLQYLEKEVRNGVHFLHTDKHQVGIIVFDVTRNVHSPQNRKLVIFLHYIKDRNCFCVLL